MMREANVITIGAGGASYPAAFLLAKAGYKVIMIDDKGVMSGNCLYEGCIPSKTMREIAQLIIRKKRFEEFGVLGEVKVDYKRMISHKDKVQEMRYKQHEEELKETNGMVEIIKGIGEIIDPTTVLAKTENGNIEFKAKNGIIIGTGTIAVKPEIEGKEYCITSDDIYKLHPTVQDLPDSFVIIGGGYIALETASFFQAFGSKVTVLVRGHRFLRTMDEEFVSKLVSLLDPEIKVEYNSPVKRIEKASNKFKVIYSGQGTEKEIEADLVLCATGRKPVPPKGIEKVGIPINEKGHIIVDNSMQTNVPNIYATGDVNGLKPLFHAAVRMSIAAARNILAGNRKVDYVYLDSIPTTVFSIPAGSIVGITKEDASRLGIPVLEASYQLRKDSRAQAFGELGGEIKLFFDKRNMKLIGGWMVGINAGNVINTIALGIQMGITARELTDFAGQHPMVEEELGAIARQITF